MRKMLILAVALLLWGHAAIALASEGHVDTDFGGGGELALRVSGFANPEVKLLGDGRMVLLEGDQLRVLLASGEADATVGDEGVIRVTAPPNGACRVDMVRQDAAGRFVGIGGCRFSDEPVRSEYPQNYPAKVLVERWTPTGALDHSFGRGDGMVVSDFGLSPPAPDLLPGVRAGEATLDGLGRIVIGGERESGYGPAVKSLGFWLSYEPFVARLSAAGEVESSFAGSGALGVPDLGGNAGMVADGEGGVLLSYGDNYATSLLRIGTDGRIDDGFGEGGFRRLAKGRGLRRYQFWLLGGDPGGRTVFSARVSGFKERHLKNGVALKRLRADGSLDRSLGHNGVVTARFRRMLYSAEALDDRGRVLVAMAIRPRNPGPLRTTEMIAISLVRLGPDGKLDRGFGRGGALSIPFDRKRDISFDDLQVSGGTALIEKTRCGHSEINPCYPVLVRVALDS